MQPLLNAADSYNARAECLVKNVGGQLAVPRRKYALKTLACSYSQGAGKACCDVINQPS